MTKPKRPKRPRKPKAPKIFTFEPITLVGSTYISREYRTTNLAEIIDGLPDDVGLHEVQIEADAGDDYDEEYRSARVYAVRCVLVPEASKLVAEYEEALSEWKEQMKQYRKEMNEYQIECKQHEAEVLRKRLKDLEGQKGI